MRLRGLFLRSWRQGPNPHRTVRTVAPIILAYYILPHCTFVAMIEYHSRMTEPSTYCTVAICIYTHLNIVQTYSTYQSVPHCMWMDQQSMNSDDPNACMQVTNKLADQLGTLHDLLTITNEKLAKKKLLIDISCKRSLSEYLPCKLS